MATTSTLRFCPTCYRHTPDEGGKIWVDGLGRKRWRCAICSASRVATAKKKSHMRDSAGADNTSARTLVRPTAKKKQPHQR